MKVKKLITAALAVMMIGATLAGCSEKKEETKVVNVPPVEMFQKINTELELGKMAPAMDDMYKLNADDVEDKSLNIAMINVKCDEISIVKAKEGKAEEVAKALEARRADLEAQWQMYLPDQLEIVKKGKVVTEGNYVALLVTENVDKAEELFKGFFK